nr:MAG TPA: hypothetical protein [Caudoviricetes sp.]
MYSRMGAPLQQTRPLKNCTKLCKMVHMYMRYGNQLLLSIT